MHTRVTIALAVIMLGAAPAGATDKQKAKEYFNKAETEYRLGNFSKALEHYQTALRHRQHPSLIFNIAQCHRQLGNAEKALFYYKLFLADYARDNKKPSNYEEVKGYIDELTKAIEATKQPAEPGPSKRDPAREPKGAPPPAGREPVLAQVRIEGLPQGAKVKVDGQVQGEAPLQAPIQLSAGAHQLGVEADGFNSWEKEVRLRSGQSLLLDVQLSRPRGRSKLWLVASISSTVLAAGGLGLGIAFNVNANTRVDGTTRYENSKAAAITGYVLSGVFAAVAGVSWFLWYRSGDGGPAAAAALLPTPEGVVATGGVTF